VPVNAAVRPNQELDVAPRESSSTSNRYAAVDLLRGLVMVLMLIDHTRDFFADASIDPTNLAQAGPALFLTRWITHFCAPVFAFLAGIGAYLAGVRGRSRTDLAKYLAVRGLLLIVLELTLVKFGLLFNLAPRFAALLVFWSIGGSFLVLSILVFLPSRWIGALGLLIIAGHNLLDLAGLGPASLGSLQPLGVLLLRPGMIALPGGIIVFVGYPLLPWLGVVAAGYGFGEVIRLEPHRRRFAMLVTGSGSPRRLCCCGFGAVMASQALGLRSKLRY
jgi:uncharacterized membrane protein